ncbi:UL16-binding protein 3-like isoform X2 [Moschus berezovskii]|uniref:UL16-binding protein 3-like isoform X2 n=1 Tax=Moschus berezovskii TaxID=68408 RepID=UPI002444A58B|nr:UL16-binding protein 3-like isoform X2 [Moschus berezovskii]
MPGVWEETLREEGTRTQQKIRLKPARTQPAAGKWEPWSRAVWDQSAFPRRRDPDPPRKAHPPPRPVQQRPFWSLHLPALVGPALFPGDAHSLSYNFTIDPQPRPDQPWCEVQGEVDQKVFLSYDCGRAKIKYMSPLGEEVKSTNAWETQTDTLRDTGDLLKEQMPDVTPERLIDKGPLTLQARMTCWCEDNGHISASWQFGFSGQLCLLFDSENGHWTEVHSKGRRMKEKWENDRAVCNFFKKVSMGDCRGWYQNFWLHWEKVLQTTAPESFPVSQLVA